MAWIFNIGRVKSQYASPGCRKNGVDAGNCDSDTGSDSGDAKIGGGVVDIVGDDGIGGDSDIGGGKGDSGGDFGIGAGYFGSVNGDNGSGDSVDDDECGSGGG